MASSIDDQTRARVISLYNAGHKTADITDETGVGRSSIYFVLRQAGIEPSRRRRHPALELQSVDEPKSPTASPPTTDHVLLDWALQRVLELEAENARLSERLRIFREVAGQLGERKLEG